MRSPETVAILLLIPGVLLFWVGLRSRGTGALGLSFGFFAMAMSTLAGAGFCITVIVGFVATIFVAWVME